MTNAVTIKNLKKSFQVKEGSSYKRLDALLYDALRIFSQKTPIKTIGLRHSKVCLSKFGLVKE